MSSVQALEVNDASEAELDGLRGIGPPFTRRLLEARQQQVFQSWHDLMSRVSGMGPKVARSLSRQGLTVQGLGYEPDQDKSGHKEIKHHSPGR